MDAVLTRRRPGRHLALLTIATHHDFDRVQALFRHADETIPRAARYVVLVDKHRNGFAYPKDCTVIEASALAIPDFTGLVFRYDERELAAALKPFALLHLLISEGFETCVFAAPECRRLDCLAPMADALEAGASVALVPRATAPGDHDKAIMRSGVYDASLLGCDGSREALDVLQWLARRLRWRCLDEPEIGLAMDRRFYDLVPGFAPNAAILRQPAPAGTIAAAVDPPDEAGADYAYGRFASGRPIPKIVRRLFRDDFVVWPDDPFVSFERWPDLPAPGAAPGPGGAVPSLLMRWVQARTPDLAGANLADPAGAARMLAWWRDHAGELGIASADPAGPPIPEESALADPTDPMPDDIDAQRGALGRLRDELAAALAATGRAQQEAAQARARQRLAEERMLALEAEAAGLAEARAQAAALEREKAALAAELAAMRNSSSWRVAAPLRMAVRLLKPGQSVAAPAAPGGAADPNAPYLFDPSAQGADPAGRVTLGELHRAASED